MCSMPFKLRSTLKLSILPLYLVAKDGIQLIVIARVTVKANIRQLVGGAGQETIIARVGEGINSFQPSAHPIAIKKYSKISDLSQS